MSSGGHRIYDPKRLKRALKDSIDGDTKVMDGLTKESVIATRKGEGLGGRMNRHPQALVRPLSPAEKNDDRLPDDTPTARTLDREWNNLMATPTLEQKESMQENVVRRAPVTNLKFPQIIRVVRRLMGASPAAGPKGCPEDLAVAEWANSARANPHRWAIIGGAAFKLHGRRYRTLDMDVSALHQLPEGAFPHDPGSIANKNDSGHYQISGVKVDWMYRLDDGPGPLFKHAVKTAVPVWNNQLGDYIPVATMEASMAIKVNAGRPKDVAVFYDFIEKGWVDARETLRLIYKYVEG